MVDQRLVAYVKQNIQLGYSQESVRQVLLKAGYNIRDIDDAIDYVVSPQDFLPPAPIDEPKAKKGIPVWLWIAISASVLFVVTIAIIVTVMSGAPSEEQTEAETNPIADVTSYMLECNKTTSTLKLSIKNTAGKALNNVQLYVDDAYQPGKSTDVLVPSEIIIFDYTNQNCGMWKTNRTIKIVAEEGVIEKSIVFKCTTGTC